MNKNLVFLKPNIVLEPLVGRWYAWPHLISPQTAALNITERHFKIIDSYLLAPQIHAAAVKNPKMLGGPFMDLKGVRTEEVKELKNESLAQQNSLVELSRAIKELDKLLKSNAVGQSLVPLYSQVPEILKGCVELLYDLNNNPSFRFFEHFLYSKFYKETSQSIALWETTNDERPFVLSTPRLQEDGIVHLNIPFASEAIDELSKMKRQPNTLDRVRRLLDVGDKDFGLFESFFTTEPFKDYAEYCGEGVRMRYFGHACILIETKDVSILVDPLISYYGYMSSTEHFSDVDLPDVIDYVLITHNHQDHILFETLLPLRHKVRNIVVPRSTNGTLQDPNLKLLFNSIGFQSVLEISEMEQINHPDCLITGIPFIGEHADLNIQSKLCYHVKIDSFSMLFVADSCNIESELYQSVQEFVGDVTVLLLGMECEGAPLSWLYGPLMTEELDRNKDFSRTLSGSNFEQGVELVKALNPREVYVYAMGMEPWLKFISSKDYQPQDYPIIESKRLVEFCKSDGRIAERLYGEKEIIYER